MDRVIELLNDKIRYLEKFYRLNEDELINFSEGDFNNLEVFYNSRETILQMIQRIEKMINENNLLDYNPLLIESEEKAAIIRALDYKNDLVSQILSQDLQILSCIENAKSGIIKELSQVRTSRKAMRGYNSGSVRAKNLDENI